MTAEPKMKRILAIELSAASGSIALATSHAERVTSDAELLPQVVARTQLPTDQRSARTLMPALKHLFDESNWKVADIDLIFLTTGPGSFTSLRISVTVAKILAYSSKAEIVGINTLRAIADRASVYLQQTNLQPSQKRQTIHAVLDAQRQQLFAAHYQIDPVGQASQLNEISPTRIIDNQTWIESLDEPAMVTGAGLNKIQATIAQQCPQLMFVPAEFWEPQAENVLRLGWQDYLSGKRIDPFALVPHYFRQSAAEEKLASSATGSPTIG
jgi:tRNA threonylcarbamoyladenosine biosynthesis protein TsaB